MEWRVFLCVRIIKCDITISIAWNKIKKAISQAKIDDKSNNSSNHSKLYNIFNIFEKLLSSHIVASCKND